MRWTLLAFVLLCHAIPAEAVRVKVDISGLEKVLKENVELSLSIQAARKRDLDPDEVVRLHERATGEIELALQPFGYYRPAITAVLDQSGKKWIARYTVDAGLPLALSSVDVQIRGPGKSEPDFAQIVTRFPLKKGDQLNHAAYEQAKASFIAVAADSGYLRADFDTAAIWIDPEEYKSGIIIHFTTGERFLFGDVVFHQDVVDERILRGYVRFNKGDPFRGRKLLELQSGLTDSGYFGMVEVRPRLDLADGNMVPIEVELSAQKRERYDVGVGYGTDTGPRVTLDAELRRLNGRGHKGELHFKVSQIENSAAARYIIPSTYPSTWVTTFNVGFQLLSPTSSESNKFVVGADLSHKRWQLIESFGLNYAIEDYTVGVDDGRSFLLMPGVSWSYARADDPIFTLRGRRLHFDVYGASDKVLSEATFVHTKLSGKWIREFAPRTRFIGRFETGYVATNEFRALPPTVRFFAGGDQSVRGYSYESLGPLDEEGNVIGGPVLGVFSVEMDHYVLRKWGVAAFFDAGNAFTTAFNEGMKKGTGLGLRWISPVGLFRVDFAWGLDNDNDFQLHFVIGPDL